MFNLRSSPVSAYSCGAQGTCLKSCVMATPVQGEWMKEISDDPFKVGNNLMKFLASHLPIEANASDVRSHARNVLSNKMFSQCQLS